MFRKPFKIKSNTAIRGSERRKLRDTLSKCFPHIQSESLSSIIPNKEEMSVMKLHTHSEDNLTCYILNKNPICFEREGLLIPTVYTLWEFPDIVALSFETVPDVFDKLANGANLLMAGVIPSQEPLQYEKNTVCSVYIRGNRAAIAVGVTTFSSQDILYDGVQGKRVSILHVFHDHLWSAGEKLKLPFIDKFTSVMITPAANVVNEVNGEILVVDEEVKGQQLATNGAAAAAGDKIENNDTQDVINNENEDSDNEEKSPQEIMDELLHNCFCQALLNAKKVDLPILVSTFTAQYLYPTCPEGFKIDIKKSSYKKMSKFLSEMQSNKVIMLKELSKGVESITFMSYENETLREYKRSSFASTMKDLKELKLKEEKLEEEENKQGITVTDLYAVSAKTYPFFQIYNLSKNTTMVSTDIRKCLTSYVKEQNLIDTRNKKLVRLDPLLTDMLCKKNNYDETLSWDQLMSRLVDAMNICHQLTVPGEKPIIRKGKMSPVEIAIEKRMGNKKVTVIKNLDGFGIDLKEFSQSLQHAAASSTSLIEAPGKNNVQYVQVQGMQNKHIKVLLEKYKIPQKYILGLDASNAKMKKK